MFLRSLLICLTTITTHQLQSEAVTQSTSFKSFIKQIIPLRPDGKIDIPIHIKHIKLDIGLSYNAPMSQYWLTHENDLMVFGFEPNPESVTSILRGAVKKTEGHGAPLETRFMGSKFFLIPCALGLSQANTIPFYITSNDCGCSSIYAPLYFPVERVIEVPIFKLSNFFDLFPFDTHPIIDYIKVDAQGSDLDIIKSAGHYLQDHVIYITLEAENSSYQNTINSTYDIERYMQSIGFARYFSPNTSDPTYVNPRFLVYLDKHPVQIYQQG